MKIRAAAAFDAIINYKTVMKKILKKALFVGAIVGGLLAVLIAAAALLFYFDKPLIKGLIESRISKTAGTTIHIGNLDYRLFPLRITAREVVLEREDAFLKIKASLSRLAVAGNLRKILGGDVSAVKIIEAEGVALSLDLKTASQEPIDIDGLMSGASNALARVDRILLKGVRLSVSLPTGISALAAFDFALDSRGAGRDLSYSLRRGNISLEDKGRALRWKSGLESSGTFKLVPSFVIASEIEIGAAAVEMPGLDRPLKDIRIETKVRFDRTTGEAVLSNLKFGIPGLIDLEGTARGMIGPRSSFESEATIRFDKLENLATFLGPRLPPGFRGARILGRAVMSVKYGMTGPGLWTDSRVAASVAFEDVKLEHALAGIPVQVAASGRLDVEGPFVEPRFSAEIRSSAGRVARNGFAVGSSDILLRASGTKSAVDISRLEASFNELSLDVAAGKKLEFKKASLSGQARLDLARKTVTLTSFEGRLPGFAPIKMTGGFGLEKGGTAQVRFESRELDVSGIRSLGAPFLPRELAEWDLGGTTDLSLEVRGPLLPGRGWGYSGTVSLSKVKFNDPTFAIAGEGLEPEIKLEGTYAAAGGLSFTGSADLRAGESLVKSVYISWAKDPLRATFTGRYDAGSGAFDQLAARVLIPTIGEASLTGSIKRRPKLVFALNATSSLSLGPLYSLSTQAGEAPENRLKLSGTLGANFEVGNDAGPLVIKGRLTLADSTVEHPASGVKLLGLGAEIPIHIEAGGSGPASPAGPFPEEGSLRVGEFHSRWVSLKSIAVSLRGGTNAFEIEPLSLGLFGGELDLGRTTLLIDPKTRSFRGIGSLALRAIDISRIPVQVPDFKLTGRFQADFPRLDIGPKAVVLDGRGEADIFGGKIILRNLAVTDPFSPGRAISLDIDLQDLDLKKLTTEVPFGEVTGIVRGGIQGLVISYGQPAKFDFKIESVPRRGVARTFSLKAVDNLTILSGGQKASGGTARFWMRFIRGFRYDKMGIVSTLRNDTFTLNGTIREGGVEYLVKKPALFGINVVNRMPEKVISFREMTARLKRVGRSEK